MSEMLPLSNADIVDDKTYREIADEVARDILGVNNINQTVELGELNRNCYSFTFELKVNSQDTQDNKTSVFVKIPKLDMRRIKSSMMPISSGDREMAIQEESSLRMLEEKWDGSEFDVSWVELCGTLVKYNALVTRRIFADEAFLVFRKLDIRRRFGFSGDQIRLSTSMARIGGALGSFHYNHSKKKVYRLSETLKKIEYYCREITTITGSEWPKRIFKLLCTYRDLEIDGCLVPTLKGLDIRNVLISSEDNIYLLDPGKIKYTYREADLARFILTYRILYWGSKKMIIFREPTPSAEAAFLNEYYKNNPKPCEKMLSIFVLKEQLKHWHTALESLQHLKLPGFVKKVVAKFYVNRFYERQIAKQDYQLRTIMN